jgi:nitrogen PTS system EIIA component
MQLTVRDVSKLLNISERTIYRWIKEGSIPAYRIHDQYRFNKAELLEWANAGKISISPEIFDEPETKGLPMPSIREALKVGGIYYRVGGDDKESVLRSMVEILHLPEEVDREFLLKVLLVREELASTSIGDGIAIPHVRNPIVVNVPVSLVALCFLEKPVDFGALDKKPVHCLFTLISPTVRTHLNLLSRLAFTLQDEKFKQIILNHGSRDDILNTLYNLENKGNT